MLYNSLYSTSVNVPKLCGLPNIHLKDAPFRPIAKLSGRQAGNKEHHVVNSMDCGKKQRSVEVLPTQRTVSYDVSHLVSSITLEKALDVVKRKLQERITWKDRYELNLDQLVALLDLCFA